MDPARAVGHGRERRRAARPRSTLVTLASISPAGAERSGRRRDESVARRPVGRLELAVSVLVALGIGAVLLALWRRAGPGAAFVAGLTGHGPDAAAWPRLLSCSGCPPAMSSSPPCTSGSGAGIRMAAGAGTSWRTRRSPLPWRS